LEILLLIVAFSIVVLWVYVSNREPDEPTLRKQPPTLKPRVSSPAPFNRRTAKPLPSKPEIYGAAYVVDGDTIVIQKTQIRLFGIDAPELDHPYGQKAKWAMVALCKGQKIRAVITEKDAYDRTVAKCFLPDGRDLSAEMVKIGMAIDWPKFSGGIYRALETPDARKKLWLATARQQGRMHVDLRP
jgi:micrococcal nuclease